MALDLALQVSLSGLAANQRALAQTSQNIANADTRGYTRKEVPLSSDEILGRPLGLRAGEARRDVDLAMLAERDARGAAAAAAELRERVLRPIEQVHGRPEDNSSLPARIGVLKQSFIQLRGSPADPELARGALAAAEDVVQQFRDAGNAVVEARRQAQDGLVREVNAINEQLVQLADLTDRIQTEIVAGRTAADLEDQRDLALQKLSESLPVRALRQADGGIVLLARNGINLPLPTRGEPILSTQMAETGPEAFYGPGGNLPGVMLGTADLTRQLLGGRIAEYVQLRDTILPRMLAELDVAAVELAGRMESVGLRLFTGAGGGVPDRRQDYALGGHAGFSLEIRVNPGLPPNAQVLRDGTHDIAAPNWSDPNTPADSPDAFTVNPSEGPRGFTTLLDRVLNHALGEQAAAGRNWAAMPLSGLGPDGTLASAIASPRSIEDFATQAIRLHTEARAEATGAKEAAERMKNGLDGRINERSGVNTDEEMAMLLRLQNAYAANARVMSTAQQMWDVLLGAFR
jgi:flagellar hook-associated protein 1